MTNTNRARRRAAAALAGVVATLPVVLLATPTTAGAATVQLEHCTAANPGTSGWEGSHGGTWVYHGETCGSGGTLAAAFDPGQPHSNNEFAEQRFTAAANTSIASVSADRRYFRSGQSHPGGFGDSHAQFVVGNQIAETCTRLYGCSVSDGPAAWDAGGASTVAFRVLCTGSNGCPASAVTSELRGIRITLNDDFAPSITGVSGSLTSTQTTTRTRSLTINATDAGTGVYRRRLIIDDQAQPPVTIDSNGGKCATPFTVRVPCKLSASESLSFDTDTLTDGTHDLAVRVTDATDQNQVQSQTWTIKVDNKPPTFNGPTVTGAKAQVGEPLTCNTGPVAGQSPTVAYQWVRSNADGSGATDIAGATTSSYTPTAADVNRKVLCRASASDGGGTTTKTSAGTSGPFANGAVVEPAPAPPAPTPTPTPAATPTPAPETCPTTPTGTGTAATQDLDGDNIPNCRDSDDDGDGFPDVDDPAPLDKTVPNTGTQSTTPDPTSDTRPGTAPETSAASTTSTVTTTVLRLGKDTTTSLTRRATWQRSAFTLRGKLTDAAGKPVTELPMQITQTINGRDRALAATRTDSNGTWSIRIPRGPSRTITVKATDGTNTATVQVRQTVRAHVTLRAARRTLNRSGRVVFRGRIYGGHTNSREKLVEFQIHYRGAWRTVSTLKVSRSGRFAVSYRFGSRAYGTYRFRARTLPTVAYPFSTGASLSTKSTVRIR